MKDKLYSLYQLQLVDTKLDELRELRGDLPDAVKELADRADALREKIEEFDAILEQGALDRAGRERETLELMGKIDKYKAQQLEVKNNKEYDALTHEIEQAENTILSNEESIELFVAKAEEIRESREVSQTELEQLSQELDVKHQELGEIMETTAQEEKAFEKKRTEAIEGISAEDLELYERIRNAKGKAVATIKRGSCSGCYNLVPPQLILEIKTNSRLFTCEHCGRILVSEEISQEPTL